GPGPPAQLLQAHRRAHVGDALAALRGCERGGGEGQSHKREERKAESHSRPEVRTGRLWPLLTRIRRAHPEARRSAIRTPTSSRIGSGTRCFTPSHPPHCPASLIIVEETSR